MIKTKTKTKIYYWLKFDKFFFENLFIKKLNNTPGGYEMIVIYIRLMLESLDNGCVINYEGMLGDYIEELALKLNVTEQQINMTLAYFTQCGVVQVDGNGNTYYPQAEALIAQETNWNKYKKNKKLENFQPHSNFIPTDIEIEKDIDKDKDIELDVEEDKKQSSASEDSLKVISDFFQQEIGVLSPNQFEQLSDYLTHTKMEVEVIKTAITKAADNGKRSFGYVNSILRNWRQNGITTLVQVEEEQRNFESSRKQADKLESGTYQHELPF